MPKHTLAYADGYLCVTCEVPEWHRPVVRTMYWPVVGGEMPRARAELLPLGAELLEWRAFDMFAYRFADSVHGTREFLVPGNMEAVHVADRDVPAPKTVKPVRWNMGRWEKLLAKGWVPA